MPREKLVPQPQEVLACGCWKLGQPSMMLRRSVAPGSYDARIWPTHRAAIRGWRSRYLRFASGFATWRAESMNRRAKGDNVRFLSVMMPIGRRCGGDSIRKIASGRCLPKCTMEAGSIVRKRPVAIRW